MIFLIFVSFNTCVLSQNTGRMRENFGSIFLCRIKEIQSSVIDPKVYTFAKQSVDHATIT